MKFRIWKIIFLLLGGGFLVVGILIATYTNVASAPPIVSLKFEGFAMLGTNISAQIRFTNKGKIPVWSNGFSAKSEKPADFISESRIWYSGLTMHTAPSSNFVFRVNLPSGRGSWLAGAQYTYYDHYPAKRLFTEWYIRGQPRSRFEYALYRTAIWILNRFLDPKPQTAEAFTPSLTNRPPAALPLAKPQ
jgi:hypothetical protein